MKKIVYFKLTLGNEIRHKINDVTGLKIIINFVTFKILIIKSTLFPHRNTDNTLRLTERRSTSS